VKKLGRWRQKSHRRSGIDRQRPVDRLVAQMADAAVRFGRVGRMVMAHAHKRHADQQQGQRYRDDQVKNSPSLRHGLQTRFTGCPEKHEF